MDQACLFDALKNIRPASFMNALGNECNEFALQAAKRDNIA